MNQRGIPLRGRWEARLFHIGVTAALLLLPIFVTMSVLSTNALLEGVAERVLSLPMPVTEAMDELLSALSKEPQSYPCSTPSLPVYPALTFLPPLDSAGTIEYAPTHVSLAAASVVISPNPASGEEAERIARVVESTCVADRLQGIYREGRPPSAGSLPVIPFVYAVIPVPEGEVAVFYPATRFDAGYDIKSRPWYRAEDRTATLYHDYITNKTFLSYVRTASGPGKHGKVVADFDISQQAEVAVSGILSLNCLFALIGLLAYCRLYLYSRARFQLWLIASTALLLVTYVLLVIDSGMKSMGGLGVDFAVLLSRLHLIPSGAILVGGGLVLLGLSSRWVYGSVAAIAALEITAGAMAVEGVTWLATCVACGVLLAFGTLVYAARSHIPNYRFQDLPLHPRSVAGYCAVSYWVWGLTQLSMLFLESPELSRLVRGLFAGSRMVDLFLGRPGAFVLLLYGKGIAILFTILFLAALSTTRKAREVDAHGSLPAVCLDADGRVEFSIGLANVPTGAYFPDLIEAGPAAEEVKRGLHDRVKVAHLLCRIPVLGKQLLRVDVEEASTGPSARRVWIRSFDTGELFRSHESSRVREVATVLRECEERVLSGVNREAVSPDTLVVLSRARELTAELRHELDEASSRTDIVDTTLGRDECRALLKVAVAKCEAALPELTVEVNTDNMPTLLRIAPTVFEQALAHSLRGLQLGFRGLAQPPRLLKIATDTGSRESDRLWQPRVTVRIASESALLDAGEASRLHAIEAAGFRVSNSGYSAADALATASFLLRAFGGHLGIQPEPDSVVREVSLSVLYFSVMERST